MADEKLLAILRQGADAWNEWRKANQPAEIDLSGLELFGWSDFPPDFSEIDLSGANLSMAKIAIPGFVAADLSGADLRGAIFFQVNLSRANLWTANFGGGSLIEVDCRDAYLGGVDFSSADLRTTDLREANLEMALLDGTILVNTNLAGAKRLESIEHFGPSAVDYRTLENSWPLPLTFLRGCGLPDHFIDYLPSLLKSAMEFYSVFISYSSSDQGFAKRLHADLQDKGVRCWFAPENMKIGDKIRDTIDHQIRVRDKLLLILSDDSLSSVWIEDEVETAFAEERRRSRMVLFPVRIDNAVMDSDKSWAAKLQDTRHIGDFTNWKDHDAYQSAFERLLRDLRK